MTLPPPLRLARSACLFFEPTHQHLHFPIQHHTKIWKLIVEITLWAANKTHYTTAKMVQGVRTVLLFLVSRTKPVSQPCMSFFSILASAGICCHYIRICYVLLYLAHSSHTFTRIILGILRNAHPFEFLFLNYSLILQTWKWKGWLALAGAGWMEGRWLGVKVEGAWQSSFCSSSVKTFWTEEIQGIGSRIRYSLGGCYVAMQYYKISYIPRPTVFMNPLALNSALATLGTLRPKALGFINTIDPWSRYLTSIGEVRLQQVTMVCRYMYICVRIYVYVCMYMYVCMYVCMHVMHVALLLYCGICVWCFWLQTRQMHGIDVENTVVILDEAHNIVSFNV